MRVNTYKVMLNADQHNFLVKESAQNYSEEGSFTSIDSVANVLCGVFQMDRLAEEHCILIGVNSENKPVGFFELSHGNVCSSIVAPREIFIRLLLSGSVRFLLAHNHPSGDPSPSQEDRILTKRLIECGKLMGVELLDHIIIGRNDSSGRYTYYSLRMQSNLFDS